MHAVSHCNPYHQQHSKTLVSEVASETKSERHPLGYRHFSVATNHIRCDVCGSDFPIRGCSKRIAMRDHNNTLIKKKSYFYRCQICPEYHLKRGFATYQDAHLDRKKTWYHPLIDNCYRVAFLSL